jgi:hypothetical protein
VAVVTGFVLLMIHRVVSRMKLARLETIDSLNVGSDGAIVIASNRDVGVLYGAFSSRRALFARRGALQVRRRVRRHACAKAC